tara:strand:+ start:212 stop:424 length:213 start_codon:yes stop_codon:yes gene_type:complete
MMNEEETLKHLKWLRSPERKKQIATTERKRQELLHVIKTIGGPSIYVLYNHYLKEMGCEALIPDGQDKDG